MLISRLTCGCRFNHASLRSKFVKDFRLEHRYWYRFLDCSWLCCLLLLGETGAAETEVENQFESRLWYCLCVPHFLLFAMKSGLLPEWKLLQKEGCLLNKIPDVLIVQTGVMKRFVVVDAAKGRETNN